MHHLRALTSVACAYVLRLCYADVGVDAVAVARALAVVPARSPVGPVARPGPDGRGRPASGATRRATPVTRTGGGTSGYVPLADVRRCLVTNSDDTLQLRGGVEGGGSPYFSLPLLAFLDCLFLISDCESE